MHADARALIERLHLQPHPEGGYYRETYRSSEHVTSSRGTKRSALTSIVFLLTSELFSAFHRLASDEIWHFYQGAPVMLELIEPAGTHLRRPLGSDARQAAIPAGTYFAAHVDAENGYALVGCDVAPGFEFADFHLTSRAMLSAAYPQYAPLIARYTR